MARIVVVLNTISIISYLTQFDTYGNFSKRREKILLHEYSFIATFFDFRLMALIKCISTLM